jgi:monofunctional biosynthetic peptidoglycan transglycosylase
MIRLVFRWVFRILLGLTVLSVLWVLLYKWINPPITFLHISDRFNVEACDYHYQWVNLDEISPYMPLAVISSEDNHFLEHSGFDWEAIEKARKYNENHKKKRGASTISQQTAKNVFLWPSRSWVRKGLEVYFTFWMELLWSKERIMEVYLNVIEMGPCTYGVNAAADLYFNTEARSLTKEQAALIASCLPNPKKFRLAKPSAYMQKRKGQIMRVMGCLGDDFFSKHISGERDLTEEEVNQKLKKVRSSYLIKPETIEVLKEEEEPDTTIQEIEKDTLSN